MLVTHNVTGYGETGVHNELGIRLRGFEQIAKGGVLLLLVVALFAPGGNRLTMENNRMEKGLCTRLGR